MALELAKHLKDAKEHPARTTIVTVLGVAVLAGAVFALVKTFPTMRRYARMERM